MLNTARFAAIVNKTNLDKFKEVASVPAIKKSDTELEARRKKMDATLDAQIKEWTDNTDKYPDKYTIAFHTYEGSHPASLNITIKNQSSMSSPTNIWGKAFSLSYAERGEWLQTLAYRCGLISPEKQLKSYLKEADFKIKKFIKENP